MVDEASRDVRSKLLKKGGLTPEYINQSIPTQPLRLRFGPGRGTASRPAAAGASYAGGSAWLMGSKTLVGSPFDIMYQAVRVRFNTSTPNVYFAIVHSREAVNPQVLGGTVDIPYLPTKSDDLSVSDQNTSPVYSFQPGTLKVYALGAGSSVDPGKGSLIKFQGFGSAGVGGVGFSADLYPV